MGGSLIRRVLVVLLLAALLAPVLEAFDRWDSTPGLAHDTEFRVAALAIAAGLLTTICMVTIRIRCLFAPSRHLRPRAACASSHTIAPLPFLSGSSPPNLPLRI
jgi:hypothetical protein